ncbi:lysis protein [Salmonella enterica]|nr:lysis protein [Salmonella enterica]
MKKTFFIAGVLAVFSLAACQMNNIHDTGGAVAPVSTVTGIKLGGTGYDNP